MLPRHFSHGVVKVSTDVIARKGLDRNTVNAIAANVADIRGCTAHQLQALVDDVDIVSSGAVGAGFAKLYPDRDFAEIAQLDVHDKSLCAAVGQPNVIQAYIDAFHCFHLQIAQLLYDQSVLRRKATRATLERRLSRKDVVAVINENDAVNTEELESPNNPYQSFTDNDHLATEYAKLVQDIRNADDPMFVVFLTRTNGILRNFLDDSSRIPVVEPHKQLDASIFTTGNGNGRGGYAE